MEAIPARRIPLINPVLRWFLFALILANIASEMLYSLLPIYMSELGSSVDQIGMVFSLASVAMLVLQLAGGWLSDSIGRLRAVAIGGAVATLGYFGMVLARSWPAVLIAIILEYVSGALIGPSYGAFIAEQSSAESRGRVFGISQGIYSVVTVIGPPLGGFLAFRVGFKLMLFVAALIYTSATVVRIWMAVAAKKSEGQTGQKLSLGLFRSHLGSMLALVMGGGLITWILITDGVRDIGYRLSGELQPLYFRQIGGLNTEQIGLIISLFGIASMIATLLSGWISDRFGERVAIALGFLVQFAGGLIFLLAGTYVQFALSVFVFGLGAGMMAPAYSSLVSKAVPENLRGMAFGLFQSSIGIVSLPAPWLGAMLWSRFNPRLPFVLTAVAMLVVIVPVWSKFKISGKSIYSKQNTINI